jgi:hypothetical protein
MKLQPTLLARTCLLVAAWPAVAVAEGRAAPVIPPEPPSVTVSATATYGIGGYSALGGQLHGFYHLPGWSTEAVAGTFDVGLLFGVQVEPQFLQYGVLDGQENSAQRLNTFATLGHSFHLGAERRSMLGAHLFAGWSHVFSQASLVNPTLGIDRSASDDYGRFNVGAILQYDYRFSEWIGLDVQAVGPFPVQPSYVTTLFHVGIGLTAYVP